MTKIKMIYCSDKNGGIGIDNKIPWYSKEDFKYFKDYTTDSTIIMGYNTWMSLPVKPLPQRINIVVANNAAKLNNEKQSHMVEFIEPDTFELFLKNKHIPLFAHEVIIIGGAKMYGIALPYADEISHTTISGDYVCDTYFSFNTDDWVEAENFDISPVADVKIWHRK